MIHYVHNSYCCKVSLLFCEYIFLGRLSNNNSHSIHRQKKIEIAQFIYLFIYEFLSRIASSVLKVNCYQ